MGASSSCLLGFHTITIDRGGRCGVCQAPHVRAGLWRCQVRFRCRGTWYGRDMRKSVLPGVALGLIPLTLALCATMCTTRAWTGPAWPHFLHSELQEAPRFEQVSRESAVSSQPTVRSDLLLARAPRNTDFSRAAAPARLATSTKRARSSARPVGWGLWPAQVGVTDLGRSERSEKGPSRRRASQSHLVVGMFTSLEMRRNSQTAWAEDWCARSGH
jgi:hypothetical protein